MNDVADALMVVGLALSSMATPGVLYQARPDAVPVEVFLVSAWMLGALTAALFAMAPSGDTE